ncbi:c-type cytochrome [Roseateles sp. DAIF2]|uniref:c-type cytochrome n=1 Tax=Roseateles sp. DAIF2 TaxID=2714952 RepID=UPI0018A32665|nr:cytochrome c [Roseateles sp. DAIF2]QPF72485.1 c-type cytochrome [Roseateles sp. DAIF2]
MSRARRWVAAALLLLGAAGAAAIYGLNRLDEQPAGADAFRATPALVERGAYLARAGNCMGCHTTRGGQAYAGGRAVPTPFGAVFAPNLTPHAETGLGAWDADDFWRALHNGRGRDGRLLSPAFPYTNYALVTRADSDALFAYLQSLAPVAQPRRESELRFPYNTQAALAVWRALYFRPEVFRPDPGRGEVWNRGAYLVQGLGHCSACHAPRNGLGANGGPADFSGGLLEGLGWYAPSLHDTAEASVARWSPEALRQWLRSGRNEHATALGPMAEVVLGSTQHLSDADLDAMSSYLRGLPLQAHARAKPPRPEPGLRELGAKLYEQHCASCHGAQGEGVPGIYPALAGNRAVTMDSGANVLRIMLRGGFAPATAGNPRPFGMPPFAGVLSDHEIAAVASHLRNSWGNKAGDIRPLDVLQHK